MAEKRVEQQCAAVPQIDGRGQKIAAFKEQRETSKRKKDKILAPNTAVSGKYS